jgi:hypothetical protein
MQHLLDHFVLPPELTDAEQALGQNLLVHLLKKHREIPAFCKGAALCGGVAAIDFCCISGTGNTT